MSDRQGIDVVGSPQEANPVAASVAVSTLAMEQ